MSNRPKPPEEVILVGYWLTEARTTLQGAYEGKEPPYNGDPVAYAFAYLTSAVAAVPAARESLSDELKNNGMSPSNGLYDIRRACQQLQALAGAQNRNDMEVQEVSDLIGRGHEKLARMLSRMGFAQITDADFARLRKELDLAGGGGSR